LAKPLHRARIEIIHTPQQIDGLDGEEADGGEVPLRVAISHTLNVPHLKHSRVGQMT